MLSILKATYISDYKIDVSFSNGKTGLVDFLELINKPHPNVFQKLRNLDEFKKFRVDYTLCWGDDLDVAPEYLFFKVFEKEASLQEQFKKWGYAA